ncbi:Nuclear pore complex protein NUP58 [Vitis vinifera]|uniref:Nuclear pore complex protein NUP58 n=1 Tax=Vitis vinifera TaxID=29760 RepID=A0A438KPS9_VITVI|nr:Nuclear pore complex protein NUP58 [Vitis vinifera]
MAFSLFSSPQPQQPQQLFQPQPQPQQPFQQPNPFLQQQQQQQQQQQLQQQQQQQFQQPQFQQQQQQPLYLFTNDKAPATYSTKWADLHPDSQKFLLQIEERILEYRDESQRLDQCGRLYDSSVSNDAFELDASRIVQDWDGLLKWELVWFSFSSSEVEARIQTLVYLSSNIVLNSGFHLWLMELRTWGVSTAMERQKAVLQELMAVVKDMLRNTEVAVRSFMMLRPRFLHPGSGAVSSAPAPSQAPGATVVPSASSQLTVTSMAPVFDSTWIEELEQLLIDFDRNSSNGSSSLLQSLPKVMSNVHDFFVHVAAKLLVLWVESIHQYIESMKMAYLADQRRRGDGNDPFLEADRRETAKQEAASKWVHPTLHLPAVSPPSTQVAGLFASSSTTGALTAPQQTFASASSGSGFSLFGTPSSAPSATTTSSLFTTPTTSAPVPSLFGTSGASPQTSLFNSSSSLFGSSSTPSLFGSTSTPSLFGSAATPSLFGGAAPSLVILLQEVHFLRLHLPQVLQQVQGQALGLQVLKKSHAHISNAAASICHGSAIFPSDLNASYMF